MGTNLPTPPTEGEERTLFDNLGTEFSYMGGGDLKEREKKGYSLKSIFNTQRHLGIWESTFWWRRRTFTPPNVLKKEKEVFSIRLITHRNGSER